MISATRRLPIVRLGFLYATCFTTSFYASTVGAAMPVVDAPNLKQNIVTAIENVSQTAKQIQQYQLQLQQYENMLKNTAMPDRQQWDSAAATIGQLRKSIDTLSYYKAHLGSVDAYLEKFRDTANYRRTPCYSYRGCTPAEWDAMRAKEEFGSASQKRATDALFKGLEAQQYNMQIDANQLERLQGSAKGASGQLQAISYANQLASHQSNQLLQIRALLIAQHNVLATQDQVHADREAKQKAASDKRYSVPGPTDRSKDRWQ